MKNRRLLKKLVYLFCSVNISNACKNNNNHKFVVKCLLNLNTKDVTQNFGVKALYLKSYFSSTSKFGDKSE